MNKLIAMIIAVGLMAGLATAQVVVSKVEDAGIAFQVQNGYTGTCTIVVSGERAAGSVMTNVITCDGNATTLVVTNGGTVMSTYEALITACTNAAGSAKLVINSEPSLAVDTIAILAGTYTALAGKWVDVLWDTSAALHYDLYFPGKTYGHGAYTIGSVQAYPGGTGNATIAIYQGGTLIAEKVITSPLYVNPATLLAGGTNVSTNTMGVDATVNVDWPLGIRSLGAQPIIVRASRVTTATTGVISAIIE